MNITIARTEFASPIGRVIIEAGENGIRSLFFSDEALPSDMPEHPLLKACKVQLGDYFSGKLTEFDLTFEMIGTDFQQQVWQELCRIPYGKTISYGDLARRIGNPKAVRAVGLANGKNPLWLVVPCHRVIGSDGSMTGYGGGIKRKRWLLEFEKRHVSGQQMALF
jgi:methylated-DNA-[protein]-cysteine S-methyltransferase